MWVVLLSYIKRHVFIVYFVNKNMVYLKLFLNLRILVACFVFCCVLAVCANGQSTEGEKIANYFRLRCSNNARSDAVFSKLSADITEFMGYFEQASRLIPDGMDVFCKRERIQLASRMNEISNDMLPCLSSEEKYLAGFFNSSFNEFIHFLCHKDAKYTKRFFNLDSRCQETLFAKQESDVSPCLNRIFPPRSRSITKREMCTDINTAKECISRSLDYLCPTTKGYQELNEKFFSYISQPCSGCSHYLSTLLLAMSIILSYLFTHQ